VGESPVYDEEDDTLYWVDAMTNEIFALGDVSSPDSYRMKPRSFKVPEPIGVLALVKGDSEHLVAAAKRGFAFIHKRTGDFRLINTAYPDNPVLAEKMRFNDGIVDSRGRFWAATITDVRPSLPKSLKLSKLNNRNTVRQGGI
jgi:sugar lactone lactonase YvrE